MHRPILAGTTLALLLLASSAQAFQCPSLIAKINNETGNRFDEAGYEARRKAEQAEQLHKEGKHAEAEKTAKEGLTRLGM
jgi:hypothetical protein